MKHVKLFEQHVNEKKDLYTAYIEDGREPGGSDKEIKKDYNLEVTNRTDDGFDVTGVKQDIEDFIEDYGIITDVKLFEQHVNEASYGQNYLYEVATPAPASMLTKELEKLFGANKVIREAWNSPEGFESVVMLNLTPQDIKKIKNEIADVLIFRMEITNRSEW